MSTFIIKVIVMAIFVAITNAVLTILGIHLPVIVGVFLVGGVCGVAAIVIVDGWGYRRK